MRVRREVPRTGVRPSGTYALNAVDVLLARLVVATKEATAVAAARVRVTRNILPNICEELVRVQRLRTRLPCLRRNHVSKSSELELQPAAPFRNR